MYALHQGYNLGVPEFEHYYGLNHLHYLTSSTHRRARLFDSERFKNEWVLTSGDLRRELGFKIIGYVLMPEHFHALIWPTERANLSQIMQKLEDRTPLFILKKLKENLGYGWCRKMLARVTLPPTTHHHAHLRVWQRKGYDMNT
jgi:REP element-mobilizing transposase RayT